MKAKKKPTPKNKNKTNIQISKTQRICSILKTIAKPYPKKSKEYKAMEAAAWAFIFLEQHKILKSSYHKFLKTIQKPLAPNEKKILKNAGVLTK